MIDKKKLKVVPGGAKDAKAGAKPAEGKKPMDPNMTLDLKNEKVEELLKVYAEEMNADNLNALINALRTARVLIPANVNEDNQPIPCAIKNNQGQTFMPIYTSKEQMPKDESLKTKAIMNMPYLAINNMSLKVVPPSDGIVINPFTNNMVFKRPLVEKIEEAEKQIAEAKKNGTLPKQQTKKVQLSPQQYVMFERQQFEMVFLPSKFFKEGEELVSKISDEREEYIEAIYEESYQQKRLYPYIAEDFAVMAMQISEDLTIVRIDMPTRDMMAGSCYRVYLTADTSSHTLRYFTIEKGKEKANMLGEVNEDHKHISHGEAPVEGAELQYIMDLATGKDQITS